MRLQGLITPIACGVITILTAPAGAHVLSAPQAAERALISYRQLDHWARQGWVTPSVQAGSGRGGRRLYAVSDVLRLAALRHFAKAGWPVSDLGGHLSHVDLEGANWLAVGTESGIQACAEHDDLLAFVCGEERLTVFPLEPLRTALSQPKPTPGSPPRSHRNHTKSPMTAPTPTATPSAESRR